MRKLVQLGFAAVWLAMGCGRIRTPNFLNKLAGGTFFTDNFALWAKVGIGLGVIGNVILYGLIHTLPSALYLEMTPDQIPPQRSFADRLKTAAIAVPKQFLWASITGVTWTTIHAGLMRLGARNLWTALAAWSAGAALTWHSTSLIDTWIPPINWENGAETESES